MTRDYAKKSRSSSGSRSNNKKGTRKSSPKRSQVPAWVWLFTGSVLGAFIMFLAFLSGLTPSSTPAPAQPEAPVASKSSPDIPKPRFDFYQLLKETEVVVQEPTPGGKGKNSTPEAETVPQEYILQVGSFKKVADADRLRAELILMNLDASVETVTVRNGETWHRVLVGPYTSQSKVANARSTLISNDINPLLLKRNRS
ncbi:SPOR domain-containing protein [Pseudomaricurvus sp. HS19]|uniref:SPOR domain-containing protein n=1 Tax=Pseudomaricurvus sp. HS19 TaxID=2692626 RepID=UPI001371F764|nr:SPOR domain-containing protein [Pseudomaricurvus sp. HS19]MYM63585.1 carbamoyl-phosphate synthase small subunit [Pseudomaricurvus sp. HS19]